MLFSTPSTFTAISKSEPSSPMGRKISGAQIASKRRQGLATNILQSLSPTKKGFQPKSSTTSKGAKQKEQNPAPTKTTQQSCPYNLSHLPKPSHPSPNFKHPKPTKSPSKPLIPISPKSHPITKPSKQNPTPKNRETTWDYNLPTPTRTPSPSSPPKKVNFAPNPTQEIRTFEPWYKTAYGKFKTSRDKSSWADDAIELAWIGECEREDEEIERGEYEDYFSRSRGGFDFDGGDVEGERREDKEEEYVDAAEYLPESENEDEDEWNLVDREVGMSAWNGSGWGRWRIEYGALVWDMS